MASLTKSGGEGGVRRYEGGGSKMEVENIPIKAFTSVPFEFEVEDELGKTPKLFILLQLYGRKLPFGSLVSIQKG